MAGTTPLTDHGALRPGRPWLGRMTAAVLALVLVQAWQLAGTSSAVLSNSPASLKFAVIGDNGTGTSAQ